MLLSIRPAHAAWRIVTPVIVLVAVGLIWQAAGGLTAEGMQSIAVLVLLAVTILITSGVALCQPSRSLRIVDLGLSLSGLATALRFVTQELIAPSMSLLGPRGVASFLSICVAWSAGRWVGGSRGHAYLSLLMLGAIANSLSRTAIGVSVFVLAAACLLRGRRQRVKASREAGRLVLAGMLAIGILLVLVRVADPLGERWTTGDVVSVGPVRINMMGRGVLWDATWRSAMTSPLIGHGPGSARQLIRAVVPDLDHPHNDYLRLLHDYGFLGWTVWMAFLLRSFALAVPDRNSRFERGPAVGLLLALIAFSVLMVTDNVLVYPFVVGPLGAIVGLLAGYLRASAGARSIAVGSIRRGLSIG
jgi:O-antigen ligase